MRSLLTMPIPSAWLWEGSFALVGAFLFFYPPWTYPTSMAVALGGGLLLLLFRPAPLDAFKTMGWGWVLFLTYGLASGLWSLSPGITLQSVGTLFLGTLLYLMAREGGHSSQKKLETFGMILAALAALKGFHQWLFDFGDLQGLLAGMSGAQHDIVEAAIHNRRAFGYSATSGSLAAFLLLFLPQAFLETRLQTGSKKFLYGLLTLILAAGLLATQSVGALSCLVVAVLLVLIQRRSSSAIGFLLSGGVLAIALLILTRGVQSWLLAAFGMRVELWKAAWGLFLAHPLWGTGLGTFGELYQQAGLPTGTGALYAHNIPLQLLVETGSAGLGLFLFAIVSLGIRLKAPYRWEGWGIGTGLLAFSLFSLVDLPFQMTELVWFFAALAGRLEFRSAKMPKLPTLSPQCLEWGLLTILLVTGFWPPFRPWNFSLLACAMWFLVGCFGVRFEKVPVWVFVGALFLACRAFLSPSALGAVWFIESCGLLLAFYLVLPSFKDVDRFLSLFLALGLAWALKVWWVPFHYAEPGLVHWLHFQYSDVKEWMIFTNPKQVGIFLVPLVLIVGGRKWTLARTLGTGMALLTILRLKASSALAGLGAGLFYRLWLKQRFWAILFFLLSAGGLLAYRAMDPSSTSHDRLFIWRDSLKVWVQSPWVGVGPGAFAGLYHQVKTPRDTGVSRFLMDARYSHNEFLELLVAFGLVGLLFGLGLLFQAWKNVQDTSRKSALLGMGAASLVDFCLHTPLIALQGIGLLAVEGRKKAEPSPVKGFLVLGLALGLFGSAVFSGSLLARSQEEVAQGHFPEALRCLEISERLNAWDARVVVKKAEFLEALFLATKDPSWRIKSDEAYQKVLALERVDGNWRLERARVLTRRLSIDPSVRALREADAAWVEAEPAMPFNVFVRIDEAFFELQAGQESKALANFKKATELEPNDAQAWVDLGNLLKKEGKGDEAKAAFRQALDVQKAWKSADRIAPVEKEMVSLSPETLIALKKEFAP